MQKNPLVIACGADENYAQSLAVTLYSALRNLEAGDRSVDLYVFDGGITTESKERMRRVVEGAYDGSIQLKWESPDMNALADLPTREGISTSAYFRLLIPEHVPEDTERVIYLDSDLLVKADLTRLWEEPMEGQALMAVRGFNNPYVSSQLGILKYEELGLAPDTPSFNSGVMVININWWRREEVPKRVGQYMRDYREHLNLCDQEGLNAVLAENWKEIDPRWNVIGTLSSLEDWPASAHKERMRRVREKILRDLPSHGWSSTLIRHSFSGSAACERVDGTAQSKEYGN